MEQLESRDLMALDIISLTPADGANDWAVSTNLTMKFNANVVKGQGTINVVQNSTGFLGVAVDVNSSAVTIAGDTVTVDLPTDLLPSTAYTVYVDNGAFLDTTAVSTPGATLLTQNFEFLPLQAFPAGIGGSDGTDYTLVPPINYTVDNSSMPTGGQVPYRGYSFMGKDSWIREAGQSRDAFTKGVGTVAVADPDQFDDAANGGAFNSKFVSRPIVLNGVAANSVVLEFDSSFRPEDSQIGTLEVRFDGGAWAKILQLDPTNTNNDAPSATNNPINLNEHLVSGTNTGISTGGKGGAPFRAIQNPAGAGNMELRWTTVGQNDWWWAIDNLKVSGTVTGTPFLGISDPTKWNLDIPVLTLGLDKASMSENGGTATGTVTRNGSTTSALTVNLVSNDTTEATVPASVVIPAGQTSVTFPITAVDDTIPDRTQTVTITATAAGFAPVNVRIDVLDDEGPKIVSLSPADNSIGVDYRRDLSLTLTEPVKKGNGLINIVRTNGNLLVASLDVKSSAVTISGATVTINPPGDLAGNTDYYVLVDDGAFVSLTATPATKTLLQTTDFDLLPLGPFTAPATGGDGTDFTTTGPVGYNNNPAGTVTGNGRADFNKFNYFDKNSWVGTSGGGGRETFALGSGVVAVADAALGAGTATMQSFFTTRAIDLANSATNPGIAAGSVSIEFDGQFNVGIPRIATVEVSYDNGATYQLIANITGIAASSHYVINSSGASGAGVDTFGVAGLNSLASGLMMFRFGLTQATGGWAAIDNIKIYGSPSAFTFEGINSPTQWNFRTTVPTFSVTTDKLSISENGGTATGTVSRNAASDVDITVLLTSSDTTEATVPVSVVIPKDTGVFSGIASVTFPITAVDDNLKDGPQKVTITASSTVTPSYVNGTAIITVTDDDFPKITTLSPADDSTAVPVESNLVVTYSEDVKKGNGYVHIIRKSDGKSVQDIDVQSAAVTIAGPVVTIDPPANLGGLTDYYIAIDDGAILNNLATVITGTTLLTEDFELLPLGPAVTETSGLTPNGKDWTPTPPAAGTVVPPGGTVPANGWVVDNRLMPPGGVPEWNGWTFANKDFWTGEGGQNRVNFTRGQGTIAVGETDEWDDLPQLNNSFNSFLITKPISLANVVQNTVVFEFDSSFRPEGSQSATAPADNQVGTLDVTYDGGTTWNQVFKYDRTNTDGSATAPNVNERKVVTVQNPAPSATGSMKFRFNVTGTNDWWWAVDNLKVTASTTGLASPGIANSDSATWNFTTAEAKTLSLTATPTSIPENGGTATVTVSRNLGTTGDLVVTLASSDATIATVPASVTIPDGQASATFTITAVDNALAGGLKNVTVTASTAGFVNGTVGVSVTDNEVPNVIVTELMYAPGNGVKTEWIEVVNRGSVTADLGDWTFDDEDTTNWGKIPKGTLLNPGQVGVIYSNAFGAITDTIFRTQWAVPASAAVVGIFWGDLGNSPSAVGTLNENLMLKDAGNATIDQANYDDDGVIWPANTAGASIYLKDPTFNNDNGLNWALSTVGTDGVINSLGAPFSATDRGSPGTLSFATGSIAAGARNVQYVGALGTSASTSLATDKTALLPGQSSTYANYTNYSLGLNGVVVDVTGLPASTTAAQMALSLQFANWDGIDAAGFVALPAAAVPTVSLVAGAPAGASRVLVTFPNNTLQNTWLRVTVLANAKTTLPTNDVFYFGNVIGEFDTGNTATRLRVNAADTAAVRNNQSTAANSVDVTNIYDVNRDGRVNAADTAIVRNNQQTAGIVAPITAPSLRGDSGFGTFNSGATSSISAPPVKGTDVAAPPVKGTEISDVDFVNIASLTDAKKMVDGNPTPMMPLASVESESKPLTADNVLVMEEKSAPKLESLDEFFATLWRSV